MVSFSNSKQDAKFGDEIISLIERSDCSEVIVAVGYFGISTFQELESDLIKVARRGSCKIILGMYYHSGVSARQKDQLVTLDDKLRAINPNSGIFITRFEYHGKVYKVINDSDESVYVGSSNFSQAGLRSRLEFNLEITEVQSKLQVLKFLDYLQAKKETCPLDEVSLKIKSKSSLKYQRASTLMNDYLIDKVEYEALPPPVGEFEYLLRVDAQPKSSLNLYFDKGRVTPSGKYEPRPWFEVELTANTVTMQNPLYPRSIPNGKTTKSKSRGGDFIAYIKDGSRYYKIGMKVHADNGKNISSADNYGGRRTLGRYLKGKLQDAGVLKERERITSETLMDYGRDSITFKKLDHSTYIIDFSVPNNGLDIVNER